MSPSDLFWLDTVVRLAFGLIGLASLVLVLGAGFRRRLAWSFGLFTTSSALLGLGSAAANVTFWIDSRVPANNGSLIDPRIWLDFATVGLFFAGPSWLAFATAYFESRTSKIKLGGPSELAQARLYRLIAVVGLVVGFLLVPAVFDDQIISYPLFDQGDILRPNFTSFGIVALAGSFLFQLLALLLIWRNRERRASIRLALATACFLLGNAVIIPTNMTFPIEGVALCLGILITGYVVTSQQILNPLKTRTEQLEANVDERTQELFQVRKKMYRLSEHQRHVADIVHELSEIGDLARIPKRLVDLIHARLGFHHIFFYQPEATNHYLVLTAAAGMTARAMMERGHRLQIGGGSVAGQTAADHQPRIVEARDDDVIYFDESALISAGAELAVPLLAGDRLLGVLDLQSIHFDAFSDEDLATLNSLAHQAALTLENARLINVTETTLAETEKTRRDDLRQAWKAAIRRLGTSAFVYSDGDGVRPVSEDIPRLDEIIQKNRLGDDLADAGVDDPSSLVLPFGLRGRTIGTLHLEHKPGRKWRADEINALHELTERLGLALETIRLSNEAQLRAARERMTSEVSSRMRETLDVEMVLKTAAREVRRALNLPEVVVRLVNPATVTRSDGDGRDDP